MAQIEHDIKFNWFIDKDPFNYYLSFKDYVAYVDKSEIYIKKNNMIYIKPKLIYRKYNFRNSLNDQGMLHVVNMEYCLGLLAINNKNMKIVKSIINAVINDNTISSFSNGKLFLFNTYFNPIYGLRKNWLSGMAQGMFASVCIRLYVITGEVKYRNYALASLEVMTADVQNGGCAIMKRNGIWFEEYVDTFRHSYVLNGNIFSIFALMDCYIFLKIDKSGFLRKSFEYLRIRTSLYYGDKFSFYDLLFHIADQSYNTLHAVQFQVLNKFAKREGIDEIAVDFQYKDYKKVRRRLIQNIIWGYNKIISLLRVCFYGYNLYK